jgi:hypothetical protein
MSESETQDPTEAEIDKTSTIIGYIPANYGSIREWADDIAERDYYETYTSEDNTYWLVDENSGDREEIAGSLYDKLQGNLKNLRVEVETEETEEHSYRADRISSKIVSDIEDCLPENVLTLEKRRFAGKPRYKDSDGNTKVYIHAGVTQTPMLKHMEEQQADDVFVDEDEEYHAVRIRVKSKGLSEDEINAVDETVTAELMKELGRHDEIWKVRMAQCEKQTTEKGACLNL